MKKRAVGYCRVSTSNQVGEGKFGIESQMQMIRDYCNANDIEIVNWYIDEAVSGAKLDRPALNRLLGGEVTNPPVQYIVVAKSDRLSRDVNIYYYLKMQLERIGIKIISAKEDWSSQDRMTAMILENFMAVIAAIERENIKIRMTGGRNQKARHGGYAGGKCPTGYKALNGKLVIDEEEAKSVVKIFELRNLGRTLNEIAVYLNENQYKSRTGAEFKAMTVSRILSNEKLYRGFYQYGDNEWVEGQHEPILKD